MRCGEGERERVSEKESKNIRELHCYAVAQDTKLRPHHETMIKWCEENLASTLSKEVIFK